MSNPNGSLSIPPGSGPGHDALQLPKSVENARLSDQVYETLLAAILAGRLAAGAVIAEVALATQLGISRTPVHDALKQLAKDGLVEQQANRRAVVARFTREDVHDIFEMRKLLEGEAARRAADHIDRHTLARLRATANVLVRTRDKPDYVASWADFDDEFHCEIARASGSLRLFRDISRYRMFHLSFNRLATTVDCLQPALEEHVRILDALGRRDPEGARREMAAHIHEWQAYFVRHFPR
jgi:DNA-binding GntR family transcriptional regulator